jgi:hypothetical protein
VGVEPTDESAARGGARLQRKAPALEGTARFLISFAAAVAAVVVFAWASQARQDEAIRRNDTAIAVIHTKLDFICEKLDEIKAMLAEGEGDAR